MLADTLPGMVVREETHTGVAGSVVFDRAADYYDATRGFPLGVDLSAPMLARLVEKRGTLPVHLVRGGAQLGVENVGVPRSRPFSKIRAGRPRASNAPALGPGKQRRELRQPGQTLNRKCTTSPSWIT